MKKKKKKTTTTFKTISNNDKNLNEHTKKFGKINVKICLNPPTPPLYFINSHNTENKELSDLVTPPSRYSMGYFFFMID